MSVFNFTAVSYSLHKCSETILLLKRQFTVHVSPVFCALKFTDARKICHRVVRTSICSILYSEDLYSKNCIVKTCETLIAWRTFCCTAGSGKSDAIEGVRDKLLKGAAMVFRVHRDMTNYCWPTDVYSQRWLSILRQLCVIIKRHAQINCYFQCSVVSLTLCKEYLNAAAFRISFLLLIKTWTFWYIDSLFKSLYKKVMHFKKWSGFLAHPV